LANERFDGNVFGFIIILVYFIVRMIWEFGTFNVTMSPIYCLLNVTLLPSILIILLYLIYCKHFSL